MLCRARFEQGRAAQGVMSATLAPTRSALPAL
jgi:hypothetical protein